MGSRHGTPSERFCRHITKTHTCWLWNGSVRSKDRVSYGGFNMGNKKIMLAHRAAYILFIGEIPSGMCVCHSCDTPMCVNPAHLFLGTHEQNMLDMVRKRRGKWAKRTACKYGHGYTDKNTRMYKNTRICLVCQRRRKEELDARMDVNAYNRKRYRARRDAIKRGQACLK